MAWDQGFMEATKARIDAGQQPSEADLARYLEAIGEASAAASHHAEATSRHEWTDQQAHDVYTRLNRDPASVSDADADAFTRWAQEQGRLATLADVPPVPGPDASLEERHAYIDAATRAGQAPDEATVTAYLAQVDQATAEASAELERRYPPGFFDDGRPKLPTEDELRGELHDLYQRQQRDPASVGPDEWATLQARLGLLVDQAATDARGRELPWVLPAEAGSDPGAAPRPSRPSPRRRPGTRGSRPKPSRPSPSSTSSSRRPRPSETTRHERRLPHHHPMAAARAHRGVPDRHHPHPARAPGRIDQHRHR
jgi:hypothetical protein